MRRLPVLCFSFLLLYLGPIYAADFQGGFSGIKWGANLSTIDNLSEVSQKEKIGFYVRPNEVYTINNLSIGQVIYGFYENRFFAAYLAIKSKEKFDQVKDYMIRKYGNPRAQLRIDRTIYIWEYADIKIKLKHFEKDVRYKLAFYYTPLSTRLNERQLEKDFEKSMKLVPED